MIAALTASLVVLALPFALMASYHASPEMARMCPMCAAMMPFGPAFGFLFVAGLVGIAVSLAILVTYSAGSRGKVQVPSGLLEEERRAVALLSERGEVTQRDLARELGISRVKAHRLVRELERRGVVTTQPYGRTKIVRLKQRSAGQ